MVPRPVVHSWHDITSGYRLSLFWGAVACLVTLIFNVAVTIWAGTLPNVDDGGTFNGRRVLYEGSCDKSRQINTGLHLLINLLSSVLLGATSYAIQCLSAPTRKQIDDAHAKYDYLDIGIISVRNLLRQTPLTRVLWFALMLSSVPLHLLYNSVIFSSLTVPWQYHVVYVDDRLLQSEASLRSAFQNNITYVPSTSAEERNYTKQMLEESYKQGAFENLTAAECITEYGTSFLTSRQDVILAHRSQDGQNESLHHELSWFAEGRGRESFRWICYFNYRAPDAHCEPALANLRANSDNWLPTGLPRGDERVNYCLSRRTNDLCRVNFSMSVAVSVVACNFVKLAIFVYIAVYLTPDRLIVLGDSIQSFLARPDIYSVNGCLLSMSDVIHPKLNSTHIGSRHVGHGKQLNSARKRWLSSVRNSHLVLGGLLYLTSLSTCTVLLTWGIREMTIPRTFANIWSLGFGEPTQQTLFNWSSRGGEKGLAGYAILANLPHLIFSLIYFQWNIAFTAMLMGKEWNQFSVRRASLRVSDKPQGKQRSRYFLQLPYRFSAPLITASILFHWLISQSLFVVAIERRKDADVLSWGVVTCGYSPMAIIATLAAGLSIPLSILTVGRRRLRGRMPIAGSCSLAIAAACHNPDGSAHPEAAYGYVKWGVMEDYVKHVEYERREQEGQGLLGSFRMLGHCGFSIDEVAEPQLETKYL